MNNLAPPYKDQLFQHTNEIHSRGLRSTAEDLLYVPKPKSETFKNSSAYSGAKIWNSIPVNVKPSKNSKIGIFNGQNLHKYYVYEILYFLSCKH